MDRIDRNATATARAAGHRLQIQVWRRPATQDKNLVRAALRGERLQPPFYYLLAQAWSERQGGKPAPAIEADFYYIAQRWPDGPLVTAPYDRDGLSGKLGAATKETIAYLAEWRAPGPLLHPPRRVLRPLRFRHHLPQESSAELVARRERSADRSALRFARQRSEETMSPSDGKHRTARRPRPPSRGEHLRPQSGGHRRRRHRQNNLAGGPAGALDLAQSPTAQDHRDRRPDLYQQSRR